MNDQVSKESSEYF